MTHIDEPDADKFEELLNEDMDQTEDEESGSDTTSGEDDDDNEGEESDAEPQTPPPPIELPNRSTRGKRLRQVQRPSGEAQRATHW
jgi:hypothetical protein